MVIHGSHLLSDWWWCRDGECVGGDTVVDVRVSRMMGDVAAVSDGDWPLGDDDDRKRFLR